MPPLLVYLASEQASNISGKVFAAEGWHYGLYSDPAEVRHLHSNGPWSIDFVFDHFNETLGAGLSLPGGTTADAVRTGQGGGRPVGTA